MALTAAEEAQTRELLAQQAAILSLADSEPAIISNLGATDVSLSDLATAATVDDADLLLIRQGVTDKSVSGSIIKGLASVPDASETVKGIVEFATPTETADGISSSLAVHPAGLSSTYGALGQCRLVKSGVNLILKPHNGNKITINGSVKTIPISGVALEATGLSPSTNYFIYAYINSSVLTLEASVTGHSTDATTGVEIKSGDSTRTLVGMARVIAGPAFQDTNAQRFVVSWFNRRQITGEVQFQSNASTSSLTYVEMASGNRQEFVCWGDSATGIDVNGNAENSGGGGNQWYASIGIDSATPKDIFTNGLSQSAGHRMNCAMTYGETLTEGYHYATLLGRMNAGAGAAVFTGAASGPERCRIAVSLEG